jgi:uncharacterized 2Fe-2S/4Fe-4S cluster protein (DUF4445 family)
VPFLKLHDAGETFRIPFLTGQSVREILDATSTRVRSGCNGSGACGLCRIRIKDGHAHGPTAKEQYLIEESRRARGVRLACQVVPEGDLAIEILSPARKSAWRSLPAEAVYRIRGGYVTKGISGSDAVPDVGDRYGIAVDLGTTQISISLVSVNSGRRLAVRCGRNPQEESGADVMTRLVAASGSGMRAQEMTDQLVRAIGEGIHDIASRDGIDLRRVSHLALVGNTAMLALLTGRNYDRLIRPDTWMDTIDCIPGDTGAWKTAWEIPTGAMAEVLPPIGGFVGSDLLAGVLATELTKNTQPGLFIDFGTNTEIALWDGRTLLVTSAAGGPAFEGSGIRCGIPAEPGAICRIRFTDGIPEYQTLGGEEPCGICGTGIVDLIAGLVRSGILTEKGQFAAAYTKTGFVLSGPDPVLELKKSDVDVFQRAKAAVGAGIQVLMDEAGLECPELDRVLVGGTFGKSLDIVNAAAIGLLPAVPADRIELCGNTALAGCELVLFLSPVSVRLRRIGEQARVINLAGYPDFDEIYLENLYLRPLERR